MIDEKKIDPEIKAMIAILPTRPCTNAVAYRVDKEDYDKLLALFWNKVDPEGKFERTIQGYDPKDIGRYLYNRHNPMYWVYYNLKCVNEETMAIYSEVYWAERPHGIPVKE